MRITRIIRILVFSTLTVSICLAGWQLERNASVLAEPQATITITQPDGTGDVVGNGDDFATTTFGDPWDMNEHTDVMGYHYLDNASFSGGVLSYNYQGAPQDRVGLLFPGMPGAVNIGKIGVNYPIDTTRYKWISFRMKQSTGHVVVFWYYNQYLSSYGGSEYIAVPNSDWNTYVIDLGSDPEWTGQPVGLYITSVNVSNGSQVQVDWARLTADNPAGNNLTIEWSGLDPAPSTVDFYLDSDATGCDGPLIHTESNALASGSFTWQQPADGVASPTNVVPGDYYVCANVGGSFAGCSSGQLTVNQAPIIHFTQPSWTSGEDYATDAGNAWDMSSSADVDHIVNGSYTINSGVLGVTVPASQADVQVHLNVPTAIDRDRYYYLTYRLWYDRDYTWVDVGQGTRVFWGRAPQTETQSDWIYDYPGWQTYNIDLRLLPLSFGPTWNTANWTMFRIDPIANNTGETVQFYIDDIKLTGDEEADSCADVMWQVTDPDTSVTTMTLYYDTNQSGLNGTYIATLALTDGQQTGLAASTTATQSSLNATSELTPSLFLPMVALNYCTSCEGACYTWCTSNLPAQAYYLYACLDDGYNELCRYSERPLYISHP